MVAEMLQKFKFLLYVLDLFYIKFYFDYIFMFICIYAHIFIFMLDVLLYIYYIFI